MRILLCFLGGCFAVSGAAAEQPTPVNPEAQKLADFVLSGLKDARDRLQSGMFVAHGHLDLTHRKLDPLEGPIEVFSAFDFRTQMFRFDRLEPIWLVPSPKERRAGDATSMKVVQLGGKFVERPDRTIQWMGAEPWVWIRPANASPHGAIRPFDIRLIGLLNWGTVDRSVTWQRMLEILHRPVQDAVKETDSLYRLVFVYEKSGVRIDHLFDANLGFSPVRTEERQRARDATGPWPEPRELQEVSWIKKNNVWVPTSWYQEILSPLDPRRRELTFQWQAVNEPIEEQVFSWEGFRVPNGTEILEKRLGKVITVARVGDPSRDHGPPQGSWGLFRWLLVGVSLGVIVLLLAWFGLRNRLRRWRS